METPPLTHDDSDDDDSSSSSLDDDDDSDNDGCEYYFEGKLYPSYQEMVDAKRRLGCLEARSALLLAKTVNTPCEKSTRANIAIMENERSRPPPRAASSHPRERISNEGISNEGGVPSAPPFVYDQPRAAPTEEPLVEPSEEPTTVLAVNSAEDDVQVAKVAK